MDQDTLQSLLAEGRLSGAQRDRILERVLDEHARPRRRRAWVTALAAALPVAAVAVFFLRGRSEPVPDQGDWLVPKGAAQGLHLSARCPERALGECALGDRLLFELDGPRPRSAFSAYAECGTRERIWYLPTRVADPPAIAAGEGHFVVPVAARIGAEHGAGPCKITLVLLEASADRSSIVAGTAHALARDEISLTIAP